MALSLVPSQPAGYCMSWHARVEVDEPVHGGECLWCGREIAVPARHRGHHMACIYCGLDRSELPAVEIEGFADALYPTPSKENAGV